MGSSSSCTGIPPKLSSWFRVYRSFWEKARGRGTVFQSEVRPLQSRKNFLDFKQEICYTGKRILEEGGEQMAGKSKYTFESKIHVYRATKRMTQQELADLVGVSRQTIMQLERNRYNPSMLLAYSIAKVFDVTIEDLFDFREA